MADDHVAEEFLAGIADLAAALARVHRDPELPLWRAIYFLNDVLGQLNVVELQPIAEESGRHVYMATWRGEATPTVETVTWHRKGRWSGQWRAARAQPTLDRILLARVVPRARESRGRARTASAPTRGDPSEEPDLAVAPLAAFRRELSRALKARDLLAWSRSLGGAA